MATTADAPQFSFAYGEISPSSQGRLDVDVYAQSVSRMENFIPHPTGPAVYRPGFLRLGRTDTLNWRLISFAPGTGLSLVLAFGPGNSLRAFSHEGEQSVQFDGVFPYAPHELKDVNFVPRFDAVVFAHENHEPLVLRLEDKDTLKFTLTRLTQHPDFVSTPAQVRPELNLTARVSSERHIVILKSSAASDFTGLPANLESSPRYAELPVDGEWALYRLLDHNTTPRAPSEPLPAGQVYATPVGPVISRHAPNVQFVYLPGDYSSHEIEGGTRQIRATEMVLLSDSEGAWLRTASTYRDTADPARADNRVRWTRIEKYLGMAEYPTKYLYNVSDPQVFTPNRYYYFFSGSAEIEVMAPLDSSGDPVWEHAFFYDTPGSVFLWQPPARYGASGPNVFGDLHTNRSFEGVQVASPVSFWSIAGTNGADRTYVGTITVEDYEHVAQLRVSSAYFDPSRDVGRSFVLQLGDQFFSVLGRASANNSPLHLDVDIKSPVPRDPKTGGFLAGGVATRVFPGAWHTGNWPGVVEFYEDRLFFARSVKEPGALWASGINAFFDFRPVSTSGELTPETGFTIDLLTDQSSKVIWLGSGPTLVAGTESAEWQIRPNTFQQSLTPLNIRAVPETTYGSSIGVSRAGTVRVFPDMSGRRLFVYYFDYQIDSFRSADLSVFADHIFDGDRIIDFEHQHSPLLSVWALPESGDSLPLLVLDDSIGTRGWARMTTQGKFHALAVMQQRDNDHPAPVALIERQSGIFFELMAPTYLPEEGPRSQNPGVFLDSSKLISLESETQQIGGLEDYEGETLDIVLDGAYVGQSKVVSGSLALPQNRTGHWTCVLGYRYEGTIETNDVVPQEGFVGFFRKRRTTHIAFRVYDSIGLTVHPTDAPDDFEEINFRSTTEPMNTSPQLFTGLIEGYSLRGDSAGSRKVSIRQTKPYPLNLVGISCGTQS